MHSVSTHMRSLPLALEIEFAEAKSRSQRDATFAMTCLRLLRRWAVAHPQAELVDSLAESLADLIFSTEPCAPAVGGSHKDPDPLATRLPWFELCGRARDEKRQEALEKEALQLERQDLVASIASLEEELNSDARAQARELFLAEAQAREEELVKGHSREAAQVQAREEEARAEHSRELALLSRRLEYSDAALQRVREELAAADVAGSRRADAVHAASEKLARRVATALPTRGTAEVAATLQAQLRALQLSTLSAPAADAGGVAAELHREAELLEAGPLRGLGALPPSAARAVETQKVLAAYLKQPRAAQQRRSSSATAPPRTGQHLSSVAAPRRSVV